VNPTDKLTVAANAASKHPSRTFSAATEGQVRAILTQTAKPSNALSPRPNTFATKMNRRLCGREFAADNNRTRALHMSQLGVAALT
jgi:hypothetical protein